MGRLRASFFFLKRARGKYFHFLFAFILFSLDFLTPLFKRSTDSIIGQNEYFL